MAVATVAKSRTGPWVTAAVVGLWDATSGRAAGVSGASVDRLAVVGNTMELTEALRDAVAQVREAVAQVELPLTLPGSDAARRSGSELLNQLDDYILPRLDALDAPLLTVVGGSTGAGKSTLVNSLLGREVSRTGVLRPTTTSPVLVHHRDDERWFRDQRILPGLARVTGDTDGTEEPGAVRLVAVDALAPGLAVLDAPDIDSVVTANRDLAAQLLMAADLWLFVTTAARYADAVPWDLLRRATGRGTAVAIVLDRVPPESMDEVRPHLLDMLRDQGLDDTPVFAIPEVELTEEGFLPEAAMARLTTWIDALGQDARARSAVISQSLRGAIGSLEPRMAELLEASRAQRTAAGGLTARVDDAFGRAVDNVQAGMTDGSLLRGEVLARWQEFVGTGEFFRQVESAIARWRDKISAAVRGAPAPSQNLDQALQSGVAALALSHGEVAVDDIVRAWRSDPAGATLLESEKSLRQTSETFTGRVERMVRDWQGEVFDIVRTEGADRRVAARVAAFGLNGVGLVLMLVAFAHTGGLTGAEIGIAGGTSALAQRLLEAIFGDQAVRTMAAKARASLLERVRVVYQDEGARYHEAVAAVEVPEAQIADLAAAADALGRARR